MRLNKDKYKVVQGEYNAISGNVWEVWECYKPETEEEVSKPWVVKYYPPCYMIKEWDVRYATKAQAQIRLEMEYRKDWRRLVKSHV